MTDLDVIKIGGSLIFGKEDEIKLDTTDNIFKSLGSHPKEKIVVTGCGESFHDLVLKYNLTDTPKTYNPEEREKGAIEVGRVLQNKISEIEEIAKPYMRVSSFVPSNLFEKESHGRKDIHEIVKFKRDFLDETRNLGITPLISGGIAPDRVLGHSAMSSDTIAAYLGLAYDADRILLLTDVDGVYKSKKLLKKVRATNYANFENGMGDKLRRIRFATANRKVYIANGNNVENLDKILSEDKGIFTKVL